MKENKNTKEKNFAFCKVNYILLIIGLLAVLMGFILMNGPYTTSTHFEPDIFSIRRIKIAPALSFLGYILIIFAILFKKKQK